MKITELIDQEIKKWFKDHPNAIELPTICLGTNEFIRFKTEREEMWKEMEKNKPVKEPIPKQMLISFNECKIDIKHSENYFMIV